MFIRRAGLARHEIRRPSRQDDVVSRAATTRRQHGRGSRTVRTELHAAWRQQGNAGDDVVLGSVAMPADGRAGPILVDECHRKRIGLDTGPSSNAGAQWQQERGKGSCRHAIVRLAKECDTPPGDDAAHFEVREDDAGNGVEQRSLFGLRDEVIPVMQSWRQFVLEKTWRSGHDSVSHGRQPNRRPPHRRVRRVEGHG